MTDTQRAEFEAAYVEHLNAATGKSYRTEDMAALREGTDDSPYGDRAYLNGCWWGWQAAQAADAGREAVGEKEAFEAACKKLASLPESAHEKLFGNDDLDTWWALWKEARASLYPALITDRDLDELYLIAQGSSPLSEFREEARAALTRAKEQK